MRGKQENKDAVLLADLRAHLGSYLSPPRLLELLPVVRKHPFALPDHWAGLITGEGDPLWRQCVPDIRELAPPLSQEAADPLEEARFSPLPGVIHRYRDRALIILTAECAGYCRFCTRKRLAARGTEAHRRAPEYGARDEADAERGARNETDARTASLDAVIPWLRAHPLVRDVLLSGGDPLTLPPPELARWLRALQGLPQLALIRIGTRLPSFAPERIDEELCAALAPSAPLYINTHFNHPLEITPAAYAACARLRAAGMILSNQTVLLRAVNDDAAVLRELGYALLSMGVRPYYLHTLDRVCGAGHFRVSLARAARIWDALAASSSGMAVPRLMVDLPGGGGKIQYMRTRVLREQACDAPRDGGKQTQYVFRNTENGESVYIDYEDEYSYDGEAREAEKSDVQTFP